MDHQLRTYTLKPGRLDEFLVLWRDHVVPAREACGFEVIGAWANHEEEVFSWVVRYPGGDGFAAGDARYYASPERAALPTDPKELLATVETRMYAAA